MAANDNPGGGRLKRNATGFAARHPDLSGGMPDSFRHAPASRSAFDHARDPLIKAQIEDLQKTEAQRRGESGRGSVMVQSDRPKPELKPTVEYADGAVRIAFNTAWLKEQRAARLAQYAQERAARRGPEPERPKQRSYGPQR